LGSAKSDSDLSATASIFDNSALTKLSSENTGGYLALGANLSLAFLKLGAEASTIMGVRRISGKFSLDF
jgi:hypothetical protein